jgi:mono/diheme cytochrome c family protein
MPRNRMYMSLIVSAAMIALATSPAHAVTPEEAFATSCGGCHASDKKILPKIPKGSDTVRRSWILNFMAGHPNENDAVKPEILEYLMEKSATSKSWWQFW